MSSPELRVVSLQASNIMRLSAVEFTWEAGKRVLTIGGKNGAGKTSIQHAVAMALGGMALCPDEPIKRGEQRGFVELNLAGLLVRREFWRDLLTEQPADGTPAYGETKSRLIVKNSEGVKQEPAQRLLDKLIGKMTFDPMAFNDEDEKKQAETLRKVVGLDFTTHDEQRSIAFDTRAVHSKQYKEKLVLLDAMPKYDGVPDVEVSLSELSAELAAADSFRLLASGAERDAMNVEASRSRAAQSRDLAWERTKEMESKIAELQEQLKAATNTAQSFDRELATAEQDVITAQRKAAEAKDKIPDTSAIQTRIKEAEDTNNKVRANVARKHVMSSVVELQKQTETQDAEIERLDTLRAKTIRETKFPVEGLGIAHTGAVTFNNIALKQASTAEQIRVSVAIGFALNPALKLLCVKNGNALDDDSFKLVAEAAENAGGQVLMEIVTKNADDVSVFIEDGHNA